MTNAVGRRPLFSSPNLFVDCEYGADGVEKQLNMLGRLRKRKLR
jgi:hypothetical protein